MMISTPEKYKYISISELMGILVPYSVYMDI